MTKEEEVSRQALAVLLHNQTYDATFGVYSASKNLNV